MAVDVLAMLIMVVFSGALLLAPSRRDDKAQHCKCAVTSTGRSHLDYLVMHSGGV